MLRFTSTLFGVVLLLALVPAHGQDVVKGADAYISGGYATALCEWRPLAEQGNATNSGIRTQITPLLGNGTRKNPPSVGSLMMCWTASAAGIARCLIIEGSDPMRGESADYLQAVYEALWRKCGASDEEARIIARCCVSADLQNQAIGWLRKGCRSLGGGAVVRFPRIWMPSGESRFN